MKFYKLDYSANEPTMKQINVNDGESFAVGVQMTVNGTSKELLSSDVTLLGDGIELSGSSKLGNYIKVDVDSDNADKLSNAKVKIHTITDTQRSERTDISVWSYTGSGWGMLIKRDDLKTITIDWMKSNLSSCSYVEGGTQKWYSFSELDTSTLPEDYTVGFFHEWVFRDASDPSEKVICKVQNDDTTGKLYFFFPSGATSVNVPEEGVYLGFTTYGTAPDYVGFAAKFGTEVYKYSDYCFDLKTNVEKTSVIDIPWE